MARAQPGPWTWSHEQNCIVDLLLRPVDFDSKSNQQRILDLQDVATNAEVMLENQKERIQELEKQVEGWEATNY